MPYTAKKSGSGYKVFKKGSSKSFSKKPLTKAKAKAQQKALYASEAANESLNTRKVSSNLEFKSVIPTMDKTEASVFYKVKSDPGVDLVLVFSLGESSDETDYRYGAIVDRHDHRGRPKKFEDPSAEDTVKMLAIHDLTSDDVEMAGQDAYDQIHQHMSDVPELNEPYEESLEFEALCKKILSE
jgi:hypothetical protein